MVCAEEELVFIPHECQANVNFRSGVHKPIRLFRKVTVKVVYNQALTGYLIVRK